MIKQTALINKSVAHALKPYKRTRTLDTICKRPFFAQQRIAVCRGNTSFELEREGCCHSKPHFSTKYNKKEHCEASVQKIRVPLVTIVIQNNNNTNQICKPFQSYAAGLGYHSLKILSNAKLSKTEQCWGNNAPMLMAHTFLEMPRTTSGN